MKWIFNRTKKRDYVKIAKETVRRLWDDSPTKFGGDRKKIMLEKVKKWAGPSCCGKSMKNIDVYWYYEDEQVRKAHANTKGRVKVFICKCPACSNIYCRF
jgi:hypothetical protein